MAFQSRSARVAILWNLFHCRQVSVEGDEIAIPIEDRRYHICGLAKNLSYDLLPVNILASRADGSHVGTWICTRRASAPHSSSKPGSRCRSRRISSSAISAACWSNSTQPEINNEEREAALELLRDPQLLDRIPADFARVVGEETNKLVGCLAAVSRRLLRRLMLPTGDLSVHCIWRKIDLARPGDRAVINEYLSKKLHIL